MLISRDFRLQSRMAPTALQGGGGGSEEKGVLRFAVHVGPTRGLLGLLAAALSMDSVCVNEQLSTLRLCL